MKLLAPLAALALCYVFFFGYLALSYDSLPARVATHFDLHGQPNGWMSRAMTVDFTAGLGLFQSLFVVGAMALAAGLNRHRAPGRAALLLSYGLWFACLNVLFVTGVHWTIIQSNAAGGSPHLGGMRLAFIVGGLLIGTLAWGLLLIRQLARK